MIRKLLKICCLSLVVANISPANAEWYSDVQAIMGTEVSVYLWHDDAVHAHRAITAVMDEMRRIDATLSPYKEDSELAVLNRLAATAPQKISAEMLLLIKKSFFYSRISGGAFDLTFASLGQHYDYRASRAPSDQLREELLPAIDYRWLKLDESASTLAFDHSNVKIDLGGIAKGYAVDLSIEILQRDFGITHASVSAGGDSHVIGDRFGRPWVVGIKNPRAKEGERDAVIRLPLTDAAVSTSGDYERYFIDEHSGERIHHILNPKTGKPASEVMSVTVIGDHGLDTDPLSTTVFVLGVERGLKVLNSLPGVDGIIIDIAGKVHYSAGLSAPE